MNRKQFLVLFAALVLLVAAGAAVIVTQRPAWKSALRKWVSSAT